jgi:hypothetical protein
VNNPSDRFIVEPNPVVTDRSQKPTACFNGPVVTQDQKLQRLAKPVWLSFLATAEHDPSVATRRRYVELEHSLLNRLKKSLVMPDDDPSLLAGKVIDLIIGKPSSNSLVTQTTSAPASRKTSPTASFAFASTTMRQFNSR